MSMSMSTSMSTGGIHLILGGIRSGKSAYAERLAAAAAETAARAETATTPAPPRPVIYIATGVAVDDAMAARIRRHRERRPAHWQTVEAPLNPVGGLREAHRAAAAVPEPPPAPPPLVLLDSLDGWVSNLLLEHEGTPAAELEARVVGAAWRFAAFVGELPADAIIVSSEVGHSPVAASALGRQFQDLLGITNQAMAIAADRVTLVVAGIPMPLKPAGG